MPETARRILDIGCAAGRLGEAIKQRQSAHVTGIELDEVAAQESRTRLDEVIVGNVEEMDSANGSATFDCILCGDILEHLEDAEGVLTRARTWLAPGGRRIASIPNVRHHSVIRSLLDGNWTYGSAGLLDRDHVRFFTRREIERVFHDAGFQIDQMQFVPGPGYDEWQQQGRPGKVSVGRLHIGGLTAEQAEEFYVYQFLVVAEPEVNKPLTPNPSPRARGEGRISNPSPPRGRGEGVRGLGRTQAGTNGRMNFTQNFITDFDEFDFRGEPFAFARFGDGERAICEGRFVQAQDGWSYSGEKSQFAAELNAALRINAPNYCLGISDACCDPASKDWYLRQITIPLEQLTFANIFVNWNYRRFRQLDLNGMAIVSSGHGDFCVPDDLVHENFDIDRLVDQLLTGDRPILVAAGPASCIIVHKYWLRADPNRRQTIVDVGSAIDELTKGRKTRQYQMPGTRTAELICAW